MGAWVDDPVFHDEFGSRLVSTLVLHVPIPDDIRSAVENTGLTTGRHPFGQTATAAILWPSVLREAAELHLLRPLIEHITATVAGSAVAGRFWPHNVLPDS